jgi:hypothetical protein
MQRLLARWRGNPSPRVYRLQLHEYFKQLTPESVQRDVDSLVQTLEVISKPREEGGTDGGWAPPPYN